CAPLRERMTMTVRVPLLAALLLLAPVLFAKPKIEVQWRTTTYESGKLREKYSVQVDDKGAETRWGEYTEFWENGKKKAVGEFEAGKRNKRWEWFHENGEPSETGFYQAGVQWNEWTQWHPTGKKASQGKYADGKQHDKWTWWWPNGKKKRELAYNLGTPDGRDASWHENGQRQSQGSW